LNNLLRLREKLNPLVQSRHADAGLRRRATLLNLSLAALLVGLVVLWGASLIQQSMVNPMLGLGLLVVFAASYAINFRGYTVVAGYVLLIALVTAISLNLPVGGVGPAFLLYTIPVAAASFVVAPTNSIFIAILCGLASGVMMLMTGGSLRDLAFPFPVLLLLAVICWLVSSRLETIVGDLEKRNQEISFAYDRALVSWSRMIELANREPEGHTQRVTDMALAIGRQMGLNEKDLANLRRGALLHDIGKMNIPVQILRKTGTLDEKEAAVIQRHPVYAYEMLGDIPFLKPAVDVALCHHESWDGKGYPSGLKGENIPLLARIFTVADNWDSLSTDRSYRLGWPKSQIKAYILSEAGRRFDPMVVEALTHLESWQTR